jgi:hypothetical protein
VIEAARLGGLDLSCGDSFSYRARNPMPRFFLHVLNDTSFTLDEEGSELADVAAARAKQAIAEIIGDELKDGRDTVHLSIMIDDSDGVRVAHLKARTHFVWSESPFAD